jgi:dual specificity protein phosphatase-like protein
MRWAAAVGRPLRRYWPVGLAAAAVLTIVAAALVANRPSPRELFPRTNYSRIEEGLYLGGILEEPPPGTRAVLNVCETEDPYRVEAHRWQPIDDVGPAPSLAWLRRQAEFIDEQRRTGRPVFVHCRAGLSRSALVVAAYLMMRDGCTRDEALAVLRARRGLVRPRPAFMDLLKEWEESITRSREGR